MERFLLARIEWRHRDRRYFLGHIPDLKRVAVRECRGLDRPDERAEHTYQSGGTLKHDCDMCEIEPTSLFGRPDGCQ